MKSHFFEKMMNKVFQDEIFFYFGNDSYIFVSTFEYTRTSDLYMISVNLKATDIDLAVDLFPDAVELVVQNSFRYMGKNIDAITYLGDYTRGEISKALSEADASKLVQIAPGIDVDHFIPTDSSNLRAELGLTDKSVIISVGRLVHRKGQDKLISALPEIKTSVPNVHLVLVGVGPHQDYLEKLALKLNVSDCVTFIGRINYAELPKYICLGDIFAMPSRSRFFGLEVEGLGIVYLEASACGLPVVGGKSGGAPDAVLVGETGMVVDGTNSSEIADACIELLNNPELCALMGANGRAWIIENWRWEIWATRYAALLA